MKSILLTAFFVINIISGYSQTGIYGEWVGFIVEKGKQYHFEVDIIDAEGEFTSRQKRHFDLKGSIIDHRDSLKTIDFLGFLNYDRTINAYDSKIIERTDFEGKLRSRYQFHIEIRNGEPWMIGFWQDYNYKDREQAKGRIFLKRREKPNERA